jgi:competence protein ComEA
MFRIALVILAAVSFIALQSPVATAQSAPPATTTGKTSGKATGKASAQAAPHGPININTASAADFDALPGIGAKTAALIVEYRQKNGPFKKVEELMNVRGIGEKNFLKLKPQLTVGNTKAEPNQQP